MSLVQSYRSQITAKQNRRLLVYLMLAVAAHMGGALALAVWQPRLSLAPQTSEEELPTPIEFVAVEPEQSTSVRPPQTTRRAQVDSTAGGNRNPKLTIQAGNTAPTPPSPLPSVAPASRPSAALPDTSNPTSDRLPTPLPSLQPTAPVVTPKVPEALSVQPTPTTAPQPASPPTAATQSDNSSLRAVSIEGQGFGGQINPDRTTAGSGVDAVQDGLWGTYLTTLNRTVDQHWQRVSVAATRRTRVQFRLNRQGRLTDIRVLQSSGDTVADQSAIQAIRAAAPFAPLPANASEEVLIVNFTFTQWLTTPP